jgi:DNA mismatch repair protein MutS
VKSAPPDALLFFGLSDLYEMFFEDAERAAPLLDVALTTRSKKDEVPIPCSSMRVLSSVWVMPEFRAGRTATSL